jgi:hypothetical protein
VAFIACPFQHKIINPFYIRRNSTRGAGCRFDLWNQAAIQHRNERREIVDDLDASDRARQSEGR